MKNFLTDTRVMLKRCLLLSFRNPAMLLITIGLPITLLALFIYVLGGAMSPEQFTSGYPSYAFLGAIAIAICQGATMQAASVSEDVSQGSLSRFMSLPISRSSFVVAHVLTAAIRTTIAVIVLFGAGFLMGFNPNADFGEWIAAITVILGFILALSFLGVLFGLLCKTVEGASGISPLFQILAFLSSAFVPAATMSAPFDSFANYQFVTPVIDTLRHYFLRIGDLRLLETVLWLCGLIVVGFVLSVFAFKRRIKQ